MSKPTQDCKRIRLMAKVAKRLCEIQVEKCDSAKVAVADWLAHPGSFLIVSKIPGRCGLIVASHDGN